MSGRIKNSIIHTYSGLRDISKVILILVGNVLSSQVWKLTMNLGNFLADCFAFDLMYFHYTFFFSLYFFATKFSFEQHWDIHILIISLFLKKLCFGSISGG